MPDFITLACPSCGGKLEITSDIDRFACAFCGHEHIVRRGGGIVSLSPVLEEVRKVQASVDKTAAELAIVRLSKELEALEAEIEKLENMPASALYPRSKDEEYSQITCAVAILAILILSATGVIPVIVVAFLILLLGGLWLFLLVKADNRRVAERDKRMDDIVQLHRKKVAALRKNRQLIAA